MAENKIPTSSALFIAEYIGPEALRREIVSQLRSGDADDETIAFLADLFDPSSEAKYKINILYRKEGSETQRQERNDFLCELTDIYRSMKNNKHFVNHAAKELEKKEKEKREKSSNDVGKITKISSLRKRVKRYEAEVIKRAKELDELDAETKQQWHYDICIKACDINEAISQARRELGASAKHTIRVFKEIHSKGESDSN